MVDCVYASRDRMNAQLRREHNERELAASEEKIRLIGEHLASFGFDSDAFESESESESEGEPPVVGEPVVGVPVAEGVLV